MPNHIILSVAFHAAYTNADDLPADEVYARETLTVDLPVIDAKYIVLPKLIEGISVALIDNLGRAARQYRDEQNREPTLFDLPPEDTEEPDQADDIDDTDPGQPVPEPA